MTRGEAVHINYKVGHMIATIQRAYPNDYKSEYWLKTKVGQVYKELCVQRGEIADYLMDRVEELEG
jgi:hypothetical protein